MVIVKLQGGLGNQMFQYAAARNIFTKQPVFLDLSFLLNNTISKPGFTTRGFELDIFNKLKAKKLNPLVTTLLNAKGLIARSIKKIVLPKLITVTDSNSLNPNASSVYLDGYFQNENHFAGSRGSLLQEFTFPALTGNSLMWKQKILQTTTPVSIHVRRQDYLNPGVIEHHGVLPVDYYKRACELIQSKVDDAEYFIFSDDKQWCDTAFTFLGDRCHLVDNEGPHWTDMALMSQCKHHIIANSSFSWWGAWLNQYHTKTVIAPKQWFASAGNHNIIPEDWISL